MEYEKDYTIEKDQHMEDSWVVYEFGVYPKGSLLAGQTMKTYKNSFDTIEEAQKAYPQAKEMYRDANNTFDHLPSEEMTAREEEMYFLDQHLDNDSILEID